MPIKSNNIYIKRANTCISENKEGLVFRPHGSARWCVLEDNIVVCKAYGPFNKELFEIQAQIEENVFIEFQHDWSQWAYIVQFNGSCLLTQEAVTFYRDFLKALKQRQLAPVATAYVFPVDAECSRLGKQLYRDIYDYAGLTFSDFSYFSDALAWTKQQLCKC